MAFWTSPENRVSDHCYPHLLLRKKEKSLWKELLFMEEWVKDICALEESRFYPWIKSGHQKMCTQGKRDQWDRVEMPEISPNANGNSRPGKGGFAIQRGKDGSVRGPWRRAEWALGIKQSWRLMPHTQTWIKHLHAQKGKKKERERIQDTGRNMDKIFVILE